MRNLYAVINLIGTKPLSSLTLCADDFGLSPSVNDGIIELVESGRLNAVSCMTVGNHIDDASRLLKAIKKAPHKVELGLHTTLTEYKPLAEMPNLAPDGIFPSIGSLILKSHLRQLDRQEISNEIERQVEKFVETFGHKPHFIDGHQHAHILPGIREHILDHASSDCWVRQCTASVASILKMRIALPRTLLISMLSRRLKAQLSAQSIPHPAQFLGVNDFNVNEDFAALMDKWLYHAAKHDGNSLIMCHPGFDTKDIAIHDPIRARRPQEYAYLLSEKFLNDLKKYGLSLS